MRGERRDRTFTIPLHKLLGALNIVMISPLKHECIFIVPIGVNRANTVRLSYRCVPLSRSAGINAIRIFHILWNVGTRTRITSHNVGRFPNTFRLTAYPSALVTFIPQSEWDRLEILCTDSKTRTCTFIRSKRTAFTTFATSVITLSLQLSPFLQPLSVRSVKVGQIAT